MVSPFSLIHLYTSTMSSNQDKQPKNTQGLATENTQRHAIEDAAARSRETAQLRNEALLSKISNQLTENARQQAQLLPSRLKRSISYNLRSLPRLHPRDPTELSTLRSRNTCNLWSKHISQFIRLNRSSKHTSMEVHPWLISDQIGSLKSQMDEGEKVVCDRMQFLEDWDTEGFEVASEMLRLRKESSKDSAEVSLVSRARKALAEKRKVSNDSFMASKEMKTSQNQNPRNHYQNRNRSPSPGPAWFSLSPTLPLAQLSNPIPAPSLLQFISQTPFFPLHPALLRQPLAFLSHLQSFPLLVLLVRVFPAVGSPVFSAGRASSLVTSQPTVPMSQVQQQMPERDI
jgi:hypothetical protein